MTDKQSVVIIGGGPAGLTAAWELIRTAVPTNTMTVLEDRSPAVSRAP